MTEHAPLIIDVAGKELTEADRRRLAHPLTGGVILFARNWDHRAQLLQLTSGIKAVRDDLLICVDHEGGRVQRFRTDGFTHLPPMRAFGEMWMDDGKGLKAVPGSGAMRATNAATAAGYVLGTELRACGVDFSFTPVLDLDWGESGVIGDRAFHRDPRVVALLAKSLMHGLLQAGMANCGKHFPGHGFVKADSHTEVPVDKRSLKAILADDAAPYPWLSTTLTSVMPAHVIYPKVDSRPAGFSQRWLQDILRRQMRFDGAIFSDDLSMEGAVADHAALAPVEVQHRREREIDAAGAQLAAQHIARRSGCVGGAQRAAAGHGLDGGGELQQLRTVFPVAGKQDDAAGQRVGQAAAVGGGQLCTCHVEDEGCVFGHRASNREIAI